MSTRDLALSGGFLFRRDTGGTSAPAQTQQRPILSLLPGEQGAYTENEVAQWLLAPWDEYSADAIVGIQNYYASYLDPRTAKPEALDWVAQWAGYTGPYWDVQWPTEAKRSLISNAFTRVWPQRGSLALLLWLFELFGLSVDIISNTTPFRANVSVAGDNVGGPSSIFHVLLPLTYDRAIEFPLVRKLIALYAPLWVGYTVSYTDSLADVMQAGEVVRS